MIFPPPCQSPFSDPHCELKTPFRFRPFSRRLSKATHNHSSTPTAESTPRGSSLFSRPSLSVSVPHFKVIHVCSPSSCSHPPPCQSSISHIKRHLCCLTAQHHLSVSDPPPPLLHLTTPSDQQVGGPCCPDFTPSQNSLEGLCDWLDLNDHNQ